MIVTFCCHREVPQQEEVRSWLVDWMEKLIQEGASDFYLGGYGAFDRLAAGVVWKMKERYPQIRSTLVMPYLDWTPDISQYDVTIYPPLELVPRRFAISRRNRWLMDRADIVVAYVTHDWGGAAATLAYARRKKKRIIEYEGDRV